ncbi:MAG: PEP-CTERM sorting domain-containing protein [Parvularculaceae bacterium]|nr:PEP-CTERM sorting domain-containing protein [Parvularculaceae bacterium]
MSTLGRPAFTIPDAIIPLDSGPIPVPGAIALFATGLAAFAAAKRKRKA